MNKIKARFADSPVATSMHTSRNAFSLRTGGHSGFMSRFSESTEHLLIMIVAGFCIVAILFFDGSVMAQPKPELQAHSRAERGYSWSFPRDHGRHPSFQTEWWYYTGQLYDAEDEIFRSTPRFGFQLTFFRRSTLIDGKPHDQMLAHAAVTDLRRKKTFSTARVGGAEVGLAGASQSFLRVWSGDWTAESVGTDQMLRFSVPTDDGDYLLRLIIRDASLPWLQGEKGWSQKANCSGCASQYYSLPRLAVSADVLYGEARVTLKGIGWMDHEFMTNSLSDAQVGWDWMGLMLPDGRSVMVYRLRRQDGSVDFSAGSVRSKDGEKPLAGSDFTMTPLENWSSPTGKGVYPIRWRLDIPSEGIQKIIDARVRDSEIGNEGAMRYWEGPVASQDEALIGYLEMTGYDERVKF